MAESKINQIADPKSDEVSLVPRGANNKKKFLILKSENQDKGEQGMSDQNEDVREFEEVEKEFLDHPDGPPIYEKPDEVEELIKALSDKEKNAIKGALRLLATVKDDAAKAAMKSLAAKVGYGYEEPKQKEPEKADEKEKKLKKEDVETLPEPIQKAIDDMQKSLEGQKEENEKLRKELTDEKAIRRRNEYIVKAEKEYGDVPGTPEEIADLMIKAEDASPELLEEIEKKFGECGELLKESALLKEIGSDSFGETTAHGKIESLAKEKVKADPKLSFEKAYDQVLQENPELYSQHEKEVN